MYRRTINVSAPDGRLVVELVGSWAEGVRAYDVELDHELLYASGVLGPNGDRRFMIESVDPGVDVGTLAEVLARLPYVMRKAEYEQV